MPGRCAIRWPIMSTDVQLDLQALVTAIEGQDHGDQLDLYAPDAELLVFDADTTLAPEVVTGADAISAWFHRPSRRCVVHRVKDAGLDGNVLSWTDHCRTYAGLNIVSQHAAELHAGRITRQRLTVVWEDLPD